MNGCNRLEREGLLRMERGQSFDDHLAECESCRQELLAYRDLQRALHDVGAQHRPREGWQDRVFESLEAKERGQQVRLRWLWLAVPAAAAVLFFALALILTSPQPAVGLEYEVVRSLDVVKRGVTYHPGDRLVMNASTGSASYAELRIYLNDADLLLRCSTEPPCKVEGAKLGVEWKLPSVGAFQMLLVVSDQPIPDDSSSFEEDTRKLLSTGARIHMQEIEVW